ncbi:hypothetical protein OG782_00540 [Streptomyces sp. NBC_00876]|uniref:hypothetical protein n=1 Tax=Streptomyces sp. NBC_00876 TaxID=2975853 RepID=UPI003867649D|nr:hypothetical protein OG782_00540 [Streptomyces sp. NBC_00876]
MRKRSAVLTLGAALLAATAVSAPAQAAPSASWLLVKTYATKFACVDAGQQYQREGFSEYKCDYVSTAKTKYWLYIR